MLGALDPTPPPFGEPERFFDTVASSGAPRLLGTTIALALVVAITALLLGGWLAWVEQRAEYPGRRTLGALGLLPLAIPSYILASTLQSALSPVGGLGRALGRSERFEGFGAACLVLALATLPYLQLLLGAALARVPAEEEEAARTLGASPWRAFRAVVIPRIRPAIGFAALLAALYVISDFGAVAVLRCQVLTWRLYQAVNTHQLMSAVALGAFLLLATAPLLIAARAVQGREGVGGRGAVANPRPPARRRLSGPALALTYGLHLGVIGLGVLVPLLTLAGWVGEGPGPGNTFAAVGTPVWDTTRIALVGGVVTIALAWTPAWVAAQGGRRAFWIEQATYLTSALPGVLLAFGLLLFALSVARTAFGAGARDVYAGLLSSGALLLAGYATRFLAEAFSSLKTAALQLDPRQAESARVLGASWTRRWLRVHLPALGPGLAVAFVLVVLAIMKELPVTLILGGAMGLNTLSFRMYDRYSDAFLADAGVAGLLLVGLALMAVGVSARWRRYA